MAEVVAACCGAAALTGWALHLGMDARMVGLVCALPVVAHLFQFFGALLTARFGHRRTTLVCVALSRQAFLPLALGPLLPLGPEGRRLLLLAVAGVHHGLGIVSSNGWNVWMGEMVPPRIRGRYFGRRTALCTVVAGACTLGLGLALDGSARTEIAGRVLQATSAVACAAGALSVLLMARQHAAPVQRLPVRWAWRGLASPFRDGGARRVIAYSVLWNGACGLSAPFFGLYVLRDLRSGYVVLAAEGAGLAVAKMLSASAWGRAVDRLGPRRVLTACTAGLALSPIAWITCGPDRLWPLALETAVGGVLLGGHAVASFALPLSVAPRRERSFYLAAIAMAGGAAFAVTTAGASVLVGRAFGLGAFAPAAGAHRISLRVLLAASATLRAAAAGAALALPRRDAAAAPLEPPAGMLFAARAAAPRRSTRRGQKEREAA